MGGRKDEHFKRADSDTNPDNSQFYKLVAFRCDRLTEALVETETEECEDRKTSCDE